MRHQPKKRFGQNFLHDPAIIRRIVNAIQPQAEQHLVEIGPGQGAITTHLIDRCRKLDVVELDRDLISKLHTLSQAERFHIHNADALRFDFCSLAEKNEKLRLLGNLPYNISTPLLFHLLGQSGCILDLHFMLQKEVVERIVAAPGSKTYGRLSVAIQARCSCEMLFLIGPGAFKPAPKVESAIIRLTPDMDAMQAIRYPRLLDQILQQAFSQRRKIVLNSLKKSVDGPMLEAVEIDPTARAETISVSSYVKLANLAGDRKNNHYE
jgi:16S rRNA (adenine1518-N6/adenine1519-N6)-dimethyltransferase